MALGRNQPTLASDPEGLVLAALFLPTQLSFTDFLSHYPLHFRSHIDFLPLPEISQHNYASGPLYVRLSLILYSMSETSSIELATSTRAQHCLYASRWKRKINVCSFTLSFLNCCISCADSHQVWLVLPRTHSRQMTIYNLLVPLTLLSLEYSPNFMIDFKVELDIHEGTVNSWSSSCFDFQGLLAGMWTRLTTQQTQVRYTLGVLWWECKAWELSLELSWCLPIIFKHPCHSEVFSYFYFYFNS